MYHRSGASLAGGMLGASSGSTDLAAVRGRGSHIGSKVWEDVEGKMARLVARRRLLEMNVKTAGRLIARFL